MSTYAEDNITITSQKALNDKVDNVNQYFWYEETGTHAGAHITEVPQDDFKTNPQGGNLLAKSNGLAVRDGTTELATFGADGATIGETSNTHLEMDYHSIQGIDKEGNTYFHLSDLRDANGDAEVIVTFTQRGSEVTFWFDLQAKDTNYTVVVSDGSGGTVTKNINYVRFASAPTRGATITVTYTTTSEYAKAYTLGFRLASADIGAMSVAEGFFTTASGMFSHTEGDNTVASGSASHAQGHYTTAHGGASHAEGDGTEAMAYCAHAQGYHTKALSGYQTVLGVFNVGDSNGKYAIILGNGSGDNARANILTVDWQGNVDITGEYKVNGVAIPRSADYIIEQGTENGWIYRKWNSGVSECWYKEDVGAIQGQYSNGGGYDTGTTSARFVLTPSNFPANLFIDTPIVDCTIRGRERGFYSVPSVNPTPTAVGSWYGHRNAQLSSNQRAITFQFYCIGAWK